MFRTLALCAVLFATPAVAADVPAKTTDFVSKAAVANKFEIDTSQLALKYAKAEDVKSFAQQMITDHTAVNKQAGALAKKLGVTPEDSDTSKSLKQGAAENVGNLKKLKGAQFDKAYVDHEVDYHQQVLDAIDKVLVPSAQNAELKGLIEKVRPAIQTHLDHAKQLQVGLGKK